MLQHHDITTPHFNWRPPPEEEDSYLHVQMQLRVISSLAAQFCRAVELYDHTNATVCHMIEVGEPIEKRADVSTWATMAAYYAVLMVYHFRDALYSVARNLEQTKVMQSKVRMEVVRAAIDDFEKRFPKARELRDQVGHFIDKIYTPKKLNENWPKDKPYFHGTIDGRTRRLLFGHKGEEIFQEISYDESNKLMAVKLLMYSAFDEISER